MRTGVKDENNLCMTDNPLPGGLKDVLGIEGPEYDCLRETHAYDQWGGTRYRCEKWCDIITAKGAEPLAYYDSEFYAGTPAVTVNTYGEGKAYYVGTEPSAELAAKLTDCLITDCGLTPLGETPEGVEIAQRTGDGKDYIFVINHTGKPHACHAPADWVPYFADQGADVAPYSVNVYTAKK